MADRYRSGTVLARRRLDDRLSRGAVPIRHLLRSIGWTRLFDNGGDDRLRPRAAQRQLGHGPGSLKRGAWAEEARAGGNAHRLLSARRGRAFGFRFKDWTDYRTLAQSLGVGNGSTTAFQLVKHYPSAGVVETRMIAKPVAGTVKVYRDGVAATSGWAADTTTGIVTFSIAPAVGVQVTTDFAFDVPVRFDSDQMDVTVETYQLGTWGQIPVVEIWA